MSHVDDGLVHAWIDGAFEPGDPEGAAIEAHIRTCAGCRARADAALRLKDRAGYVLRQMVPDAVSVEPFERIVEQRRAERAVTEPTAGSETPVSPRRLRRFPLAWAATILMAVTAGWFASTMLKPAVVTAPSEPMTEAGSSFVPDRGPGAATSGLDEETKAEARDATADVGRAASIVAPDTSALARVIRENKQQVAADRGSEQAARSRREQADEARRMPPEASLIDLDAPGEWADVTIAEATRRLGRVPFAIDGIAIDQVELREVNGRALVRVRQRVSDDVVEIIQEPVAVSLNALVVTGLRLDTARVQEERRAQADNRALVKVDSLTRPVEGVAAAGIELDDTPVVTVPQIGFTVMLRGLLPVDSLRALALRVR